MTPRSYSLTTLMALIRTASDEYRDDHHQDSGEPYPYGLQQA